MYLQDPCVCTNYYNQYLYQYISELSLALRYRFTDVELITPSRADRRELEQQQKAFFSYSVLSSEMFFSSFSFCPLASFLCTPTNLQD